MSFLPSWTPTSASDLERSEKSILTSSTVEEVVSTKIGPSGRQLNTVYLNDGHKHVGKERPVLVLCHGYGAGVGFWYRNLSQLSSRYRVYALDWLAFGRSDRPNVQFFDRPVNEIESFFIDSLEEWRQAMQFESFVLLGHSLGGYLSTVYSIKYPNAVQKLILASPVGFPEPPPPDPTAEVPLFFKVARTVWSWNVTPQSLVRKAGPLGPSLVRRFSERRFGNLEDDERQQLGEYIYHLSAADPGGEQALNALLAPGAWAREPLVRRFHQVKCPATFVYGTHDWMSYETATFLRDTNKHQKIRVFLLSDAGHHVYMDNHIAFNNLVFAHLDSEDPHPIHPGIRSI